MSIFISKIAKLIRVHWPTFINIIGFVGLYLAWREVDIAQKQQPKLEYFHHVCYLRSPVEDRAVTYETSEQLLKNFYKQFYELEQTHPDFSYFEILSNILPITATVPARPFCIRTYINNTGVTTDKRIRAFFESNQPIIDYQVDSLEPYKEIDGGIGKDNIAIEIDRITPGDTVTITIESETIASNTQCAQISLHMPEIAGQELPSISIPPGPEASVTLPFPVLEYIPAQEPNIEIKIRSDGGAITRREAISQKKAIMVFYPLVSRSNGSLEAPPR